MGGVSFDQAQKPCHITEWSSDPETAIVGACNSGIDREIFASQHRVSLQWRVGEFGSKQFDIEHAVAERCEHINAAGHTDIGRFIDIDLTCVEEKLLIFSAVVIVDAGFDGNHFSTCIEDCSVAVDVPVGPCAGSYNYLAIGCPQDRALVKMNGESVEIEL